MAEALGAGAGAGAGAGGGEPVRFYCHRCSAEFEDPVQAAPEFTCPFCQSGFIEQLEPAAEGARSSHGSRDSNTGSLDDSFEHMVTVDGEPLLNDLAFLMSGGRLRQQLHTNRGNLGNNLLQQLVWVLAGGNSGSQNAAAPFVLVGAPGDYVVGGEGLDAVVTQLLSQLEGSGPPPLPREQIDSLQTVQVTEQQVANNIQCSVCWEQFTLGETVSQLACEHMFHGPCIQPWLQLHATCPICRRCLLPEGEQQPAGEAPSTTSTTTTGTTTSSSPSTTSTLTSQTEAARLLPELLLRGRVTRAQRWPIPRIPRINPATGASSSVTVGGVWGAPSAHSSGVWSNPSANTSGVWSNPSGNSSGVWSTPSANPSDIWTAPSNTTGVSNTGSSTNSSDTASTVPRGYDMDIDYD